MIGTGPASTASPIRMSLPSSPLIVSSPAVSQPAIESPATSSLPSPARTVSLPSPPQIRSSPPMPRMTSLPSSAWMMSFPGVPTMKSGRAGLSLPRIVATWPRQSLRADAAPAAGAMASRTRAASSEPQSTLRWIRLEVVIVEPPSRDRVVDSILRRLLKVGLKPRGGAGARARRAGRSRAAAARAGSERRARSRAASESSSSPTTVSATRRPPRA